MKKKYKERLATMLLYILVVILILNFTLTVSFGYVEKAPQQSEVTSQSCRKSGTSLQRSKEYHKAEEQKKHLSFWLGWKGFLCFIGACLIFKISPLAYGECIKCSRLKKRLSDYHNLHKKNYDNLNNEIKALESDGGQDTSKISQSSNNIDEGDYNRCCKNEKNSQNKLSLYILIIFVTTLSCVEMWRKHDC